MLHLSSFKMIKLYVEVETVIENFVWHLR